MGVGKRSEMTIQIVFFGLESASLGLRIAIFGLKIVIWYLRIGLRRHAIMVLLSISGKRDAHRIMGSHWAVGISRPPKAISS